MINVDRGLIREGIDRAGVNTGGTTSSNVSQTSSISSQILAANNGSSTSQIDTINTSQIIDAICEGPIEGWPTTEPLKHIYLDGTAVKSYAGSFSTTSLRHEFRNGSSDQAPLSNYTLIGAAKNVNYQDEITLNNPVTQQVQIRDDSDGAYPSVEAVGFTFAFPEGIFRYKSSGGRDGTTIGFTIEVNNKSDGSGTWYKRHTYYQRELELTSAPFEWTFIVELPPTWATPYSLQKYANDAAKVDDVVLFRITKTNENSDDSHHSKMYLKNYTIYSRNQYSHPYTALMGLTIDSKNFDGSIPRRQYDLKLLKVKVPSNYNIVCDDKTGKVIQRNYTGLWDGTFKTDYWTDNPVWCFYDLVTNERYGLGKYIDSSLLNKWKLYEIAKYCDAVVADTRSGAVANSYTFSIPDNLGGVAASAGNSAVKEPRFTCNIFLSSREEAYSVVQRMAALFRGIVFYQNGTLEVSQDRPSTPTFLFNNTNVVNGVFSYSSSSSKARHTVAIVKWIDPDDLYSEKVEYVEDYDGIARYGYREIEIDGFGCTSRGQARRIGRHILITEKFELETISFTTGIEGASLTPGSLIKVKDSYRQVYRAAGRVSSATSSYVVLDKAISIPSPQGSVATLWLQTPNARNDVFEGSPTQNVPTLKPTLNSYTINVTAPVTSATNLSPTSIISPIPSAGNAWALSYTISGDVENTSVYKILSVTENNSYEYEVTALQHYSSKYDEIESYAPIPAYKPVPLKLFIPGPTEGNVSAKFNGISWDITITWTADRIISGTQYRLEVVTAVSSKVLFSGSTDMSYVYKNVGSGIYYFKVYAINSASNQLSEPLLLGPLRIKEVMPQNNFEGFTQPIIKDTYVKHSWLNDRFPDNRVKHELWRSQSPNVTLRSPIGTFTINAIDAINSIITLNDGYSPSLMTEATENYTIEVSMLPYNKYIAASPSAGFATSPSMVVLNTAQKPNVQIGDKLINARRKTTTNVFSVSYSKNLQGRWLTKIGVTPDVSGQTEGDVVYYNKGVMGPTLIQTQPSGTIKQKTFKTVGATSSTNIIVTSPDTISNLSVNDIIINRTRNSSTKVNSIVNTTTFTVSPAVTSQASGDIIAYYQSNNREAKSVYKYSIDFVTEAFGGDLINVLDYDNPDYIPVPNKTIMVNITKGKAAEVIDAKLNPGGILTVVTVPNHSPNIVDNDQVIFFDKDEVYTNSILTHIHPTAIAASGQTSPAGATATGLFTTAVKGDILVNATRNTSGVILSKISNNQVTLVATNNNLLSINGQTSGDMLFVVPGSSMTTFNETLSYSHPTIQTAETSTGPNQIIINNGFTSTTSSQLLYNMTRNTVAAISPNTVNRVTVSPAITGQTTGDKVYTFLPSTVSSTVVSAPDGAFSYARPGDIFYNVTRDDMSTIKNVRTLTGKLDKKIDRLVLAAPILGQKAGDEFKIVQGFSNIDLVSKTTNSIGLETVVNLEVGDEVRLYKYNASRVGITNSTTLTDSGLSPETTYYYWMRAVSSRLPYLGGIWQPSRTSGDIVITPPENLGNYSTSNDNNGSAIDPQTITRLSPHIDLPPGGKNPDSTANIRLYWEWTGLPSSIDGFKVYFWSSNSTSDDATINAHNDYTSATSDFIVPANPNVSISTVSPEVSGWVRVTTTGPHNFLNGEKVRIIGVNLISTGATMPYINNTGGSSDYFTASQVTTNSFVVSPTTIPTGNGTSGGVASCKYVYQVNNLTANYYYNAWIQPYRIVNTNINKAGIILGSPTMLWSPS